MYQFKAVMKGSLEFGNRKSYDMMLTHFQKRLESYYKNDILLKDPDFFQEETLSITVPRQQVACSEKTWKNTAFLLRELRGFAVAGEFHIWVTDEKNALCGEEMIVPQGDKVATTDYLRGVEMLKKGGREDDAIELFNKAIEKYDRYSQAYERRGMAYFRSGRIEDAIIDFSKSIALCKNAPAFLGRGRVKMEMNDLEGALEDFQNAIDNAVPYQPVFWTARRIKGECHMKLNDFEKAIFELKLVTKRPFKETDPNFNYRKQAWQSFGQALLNKGVAVEAAAAFREALSIENCAVVENLLNSVNNLIVVSKPKPAKSSPMSVSMN